VAEHGARRELRLRPAGDPEQPLEVEVVGADVEAAARVLPLASRPVGIDLDPVALGIVEIERLADEVVGRAGERQLLLERALEKASQLFLVRQQDGKVKQAGGVRRPLLAVLEGGQAKDRRVTGAED